ncbi:protein FAM124B [Xenopus laevis]|uniref:protein FAM124B n=2 Tax=Xenopus laevis TaxID=8355 RepID=A0A1L8G4H2_XENLA|nr:protein FAM124B [Xenopus laevis]XP_041420895.1 protein FAM124B [Xenopus laevis]OCT78758.1 hypothetical protein XELAEV_18029848mg [Xenopus laevis]
MDERQPVLPLTVHLLANSGDSLAFQLAVDRLLHRICSDVPLFLVSERAAPIKLYECQKKRSEFPGISVTLFLREDLGEERIDLLQSFFQLPPWAHIITDFQEGRSCPVKLPLCDYYSLDTHMPVWEIRHVHYGTEIVRLTVYCSCDNYEDAVRLYETILQKEATSQKAGFCFFVLYSTSHVSVQLSLKQLHPGISVQVKDACALQFAVHAVGQLVPLLPYPCVPISDTRWQTQDYDGNKILLLVVGNTTATEVKTESKAASTLMVNPNSSSLLFSSLNRSMEAQVQTAKDSIIPKNVCVPCNSLDQSETVYNNISPSQKMMTTHGVQMKETESNVDTGYTVVSLTSQQAYMCELLEDKQRSPASEDIYFSTSKSKSPQNMSYKQSLSSDVAKGGKAFGMAENMFHVERDQIHNSNIYISEEEEFFI